MKRSYIISLIFFLLLCFVGTASATNFYTGQQFTTSHAVGANDLVITQINDSTAPDQSSITWSIHFDGSGGQLASLGGQFGLGDLHVGDKITVFGYYKIPQDYTGDFYITSIWKSDWSSIASDSPHVDFVRNGRWNKFRKVLTVSADCSNPLFNNLFATDTTQITYAGDVLVNGLHIEIGDVDSPNAAFTSNITTSSEQLNVQFSDTSTGTPTAWNWDFGDGNNSQYQNPEHIYSTPGNYTVSLQTINDIGQTTITKDNYIYIGPQDLTTNAVLIFQSDKCNSSFSPDMSGNGNDGDISGAQLTNTNYGTALFFEGSNTSSVNFGDSEILNMDTISIICVQNTSKNHFQNIISKRLYGADGWFFGTNATGNIYMYLTRSGNMRSISSSKKVSDNIFHVIGASYDGKTITYYCDGQVVDTYDYGSIEYIGHSDVDCELDQLSDLHNIIGDIYSIYVYNTSRTQHDMVSLSDKALYQIAYNCSSVSGNYPLSLRFSAFEPGNYSWDFENDGIIDSTKQNPVHTYGQAGNYTVNLTVHNEYGNISTVKTDYITVSTPSFADDPTAWFNWILSYLRFW